jgi:protein arginine kinase activator
MTPCEHCHVSPATVHITRIAGNHTTVFHLCETCAREKGIMVEVREDGLLQEIHLQTLSQPEAAGQAEASEDARECGHCHLKFSEFKSTGRLGCARCYEEFEKDIEAILMQVHGAIVHKGKRYSRRGANLLAGAELQRMRRELSAAISREEFELAALLRDAIHDAGASPPDAPL